MSKQEEGRERPRWSDTTVLREELFAKYVASGIGWVSPRTGVQYIVWAACGFPSPLHKMDIGRSNEHTTLYRNEVLEAVHCRGPPRRTS